ncbi:MAG: hypothetical protein RLN87_10310, partial [Parasphingopyxis sp.]|uniref:hypothetical protein n=1 Tax=Parasphingopyxis sp. TaxID=1920299 RepID=UPI0032EBBDAA
ASATTAAAATAPECTMTAMADMEGDHDDMGCCTLECTTACPGMAIPFGDAAMPASLTIPAVAEKGVISALGSIAPESLDPPPKNRLT